MMSVSLVPGCAGTACPALSDLETYRPPEPPHVYDRDGRLAGHLAGRHRLVLKLEEIPLLLRDGYVAVEDRRFWEHGGIDLRSSLRALVRNVRAGEIVEGASTITMQLARNIFAADLLEYSPWRRKAAEVRLALALEARLSKAKILELYLNQIYLGGGSYGVGAGARHYFGKDIAELIPSEAALLVGLAQRPEGYNPRHSPQRALDRRDIVLDVLDREGVLESEAASTAAASPLGTGGPSTLVWTRGSYFASGVRRELAQIIPDPASWAGLRIHTGLDPRIQAAAEDALAWQIDRIESGELGEFGHPIPTDSMSGSGADPNASPYLQGMVVALDGSTGTVRALVGGRDFTETEFDRAFLARRQPGSAFKPFVLSAALGEARALSDLVRVDTLTVETTDTAEDSLWHLSGFAPTRETDRMRVISIRDAVTRSSNAAAVRLGLTLGVERVIQEARRVGIESTIPWYPSIILGSAEVIPAELVAGYAPFENGGYRVEPHLITRIEAPDGEVLWEAPQRGPRVLDRRISYLVRSVLEDVVERGTGWRVRAQGVEGPVGGKTGTTNEGKDVWFVGIRPGIVAGVWLGFDRPTSIAQNATGATHAAPLWGRFMSEIDTDQDRGRWETPPGIIHVDVDATTGYRATAACPRASVRTEQFLPGTEPRQVCPIHGQDLQERTSSQIRSLVREHSAEGEPEDVPVPLHREESQRADSISLGGGN